MNIICGNYFGKRVAYDGTDYYVEGEGKLHGLKKPAGELGDIDLSAYPNGAVVHDDGLICEFKTDKVATLHGKSRQYQVFLNLDVTSFHNFEPIGELKVPEEPSAEELQKVILGKQEKDANAEESTKAELAALVAKESMVIDSSESNEEDTDWQSSVESVKEVLNQIDTSIPTFAGQSSHNVEYDINDVKVPTFEEMNQIRAICNREFISALLDGYTYNDHPEVQNSPWKYHSTKALWYTCLERLKADPDEFMIFDHIYYFCEEVEDRLNEGLWADQKLFEPLTPTKVDSRRSKPTESKPAPPLVTDVERIALLGKSPEREYKSEEGNERFTLEYLSVQGKEYTEEEIEYAYTHFPKAFVRNFAKAPSQENFREIGDLKGKLTFIDCELYEVTEVLLTGEEPDDGKAYVNEDGNIIAISLPEFMNVPYPTEFKSALPSDEEMDNLQKIAKGGEVLPTYAAASAEKVFAGIAESAKEARHEEGYIPESTNAVDNDTQEFEEGEESTHQEQDYVSSVAQERMLDENTLENEDLANSTPDTAKEIVGEIGEESVHSYLANAMAGIPVPVEERPHTEESAVGQEAGLNAEDLAKTVYGNKKISSASLKSAKDIASSVRGKGFDSFFSYEEAERILKHYAPFSSKYRNTYPELKFKREEAAAYYHYRVTTNSDLSKALLEADTIDYRVMSGDWNFSTQYKSKDTKLAQVRLTDVSMESLKTLVDEMGVNEFILDFSASRFEELESIIEEQQATIDRLTRNRRVDVKSELRKISLALEEQKYKTKGLDEVKSQTTSQLEKICSQHAKTIETMKLAHDKKVSELEDNYNTKIRDIEDSRAAELKDIKDTTNQLLGETVSKMDNDLRRLKREADEEIEKARIDYENKTARAEENARAQIKEYADRVKELQSRIEANTHTIQDLEDSLRIQIAQNKADVEEARRLEREKVVEEHSNRVQQLQKTFTTDTESQQAYYDAKVKEAEEYYNKLFEDKWATEKKKLEDMKTNLTEEFAAKEIDWKHSMDEARRSSSDMVASINNQLQEAKAKLESGEYISVSEHNRALSALREEYSDVDTLLAKKEQENLALTQKMMDSDIVQLREIARLLNSGSTGQAISLASKFIQ